MNITFDKEKVVWKYKGKIYEYNIKNVIGADIEKKYIYIDSDTDNGATVYTHLTLDGKLIYSSVIGSDNVKILDKEGKEVAWNIPNRGEMRTNGDFIFVNQNNEVIKYSLHGEKLKKFTPPEIYKIARFWGNIDSEKDIRVICYGPKDKVKDFDTWVLSLNAETGEWKILYSMPDR